MSTGWALRNGGSAGLGVGGGGTELKDQASDEQRRSGARYAPEMHFAHAFNWSTGGGGRMPIRVLWTAPAPGRRAVPLRRCGLRWSRPLPRRREWRAGDRREATSAVSL